MTLIHLEDIVIQCQAHRDNLDHRIYFKLTAKAVILRLWQRLLNKRYLDSDSILVPNITQINRVQSHIRGPQ